MTERELQEKINYLEKRNREYAESYDGMYSDLCKALSKATKLQQENEALRARLMRVETNIFDKEEIHRHCTVQILTNSITGEQSFGWWHEDNEED